MRARMEQEHLSIRRLINVFEQSLEVKSFGLGVVVPERTVFETDVAANGAMHGPGRVRQVHLRAGVRVVFCDKFERHGERTCARQRLDACDFAVNQVPRIFAVGQLHGRIDVRVNAVNGRVLMVHLPLENDLLSLPNAFQHVWFAVVVSVDTHAEQHFLGVGILGELVVQAENRVIALHLHLLPGRMGGCEPFGEGQQAPREEGCAF